MIDESLYGICQISLETLKIGFLEEVGYKHLIEKNTKKAQQTHTKCLKRTHNTVVESIHSETVNL